VIDTDSDVEMLHLSENGNDKGLLNFKVVGFVVMTPKTRFWEKNNLLDMVDFESSMWVLCSDIVFALWNEEISLYGEKSFETK